MKSFIGLITVFFFYFTYGQIIFQSNLENWLNNLPTEFVGNKTNLETDSIVQYSMSASNGNYSVQLINSEATHKRFTTKPLSVDSGVTYTISFWVRGSGNIRTGIFDNRSTGYGYAYNNYVTINSTEWQNIVQTITAENTYSEAEFIFSIQYTNPTLDHIQLDDVLISTQQTNLPTITIINPQHNSTIYTHNVSIVFSVENFTIGTPDSTVDGYLIYYINNANPTPHYSTNPINLNLPDGLYEVKLELVDKNGVPLQPSIFAIVSFRIYTNFTFVPIYDLQYTTDYTGNSNYVGDTVKTKGIVTGVHSNGFFIQDGYGPWTGIYVYSPLYAPNVSLGDSILLIGIVKEYYNLTELYNILNLEVINSNNPLPEPYIVNANTVKSEQFESVLVKLLNAKCINTNAGYGMWEVYDNIDTCKIHNLLYNFTPTLNAIYNITGIVYYSYSEYKIEPRNSEDIIEVSKTEWLNYPKLSIYPNPTSDLLHVSSNYQIQKIELINSSGKLIKTHFLNSYSTTINLEKFIPGIYYLLIYYSNGNFQATILRKN